MTVASTIGTGQDYATPALWEASIPTNPTEGYTGTCMVNEAYAATLIDVANGTGQHPLILDVDASVRHTYKKGTGARIESTSGGNSALDIRSAKFTVKNFSVSVESSGTGAGIRLYGSGYNMPGVAIENCFAYCSASSWPGQAALYITDVFQTDDINVSGSAFVCDSGSHAARVDWIGADVNLTNCSFLSINAGISGFANNAIGGTKYVIAKNCKFLAASGTLFSGTGAWTGSINNVISDGTEPSGLGILDRTYGVNQAASDHYTNTTGSTADLRIKSTLDKANYIGGNELAGGFDVEGDEWVTDYCDTGCDAESTAPTSTINVLFYETCYHPYYRRRVNS